MNPRTLKWRIPLIAAILATSFYYAYPPFGTDQKPGKIKLGLDLKGGMHLTLRVDTSKLDGKAREDATERAMEIIRNRIDQFGVAEPSIQREGENRIVVQLPGVTDRERALALIGKTALLEFKLVSDDITKRDEALQGKVPAGYRLYDSQETEGRILAEEKALLSGKLITDAGVSFESQFNEPVVTLEFNSEGGRIFSDITGSNVGRRLAIILDDKVQSAPVINERIPSGRAQISGRFDINAANDLAIALRAGALPAPIIVEEERSVGPSLGRDSIQQGVRAALWGMVIVAGFMALYFLAAGLIANLALCLNILIVLAFMAYFQATLTLPGIAGIVLTIGMAVDTNVLIFERIREELGLSKPLPAAVMAGYQKAFTTILDSNLTTLISAGVLYYMGTGPVKGFALTLAIGIAASMFTGIFITRAIFDMLIAGGALKKLPMLQFFRHPPKINYLKIRFFCYGLSLIVIAVGAVKFIQRGEGMFGVDFTGGSMQDYSFKKPVTLNEVRESLTPAGYANATIQQAGTAGTEFIIRAAQNSEKPILEALNKSFPDNAPEVRRIESVGPLVGEELKTKAVWAFIISLAAIWTYVVVRFDIRYAFGAILALFHDGLVALAFVALTGREMSITVLAAILTILGYSINDTIVIFDRIRERRRLGFKETFAEAINNSVNLMMSRTILTSSTVIAVVVCLYVWGGSVINDFAFTMLVGLISGVYSTVYIAAPVLVDWPGSKKRS